LETSLTLSISKNRADRISIYYLFTLLITDSKDLTVFSSLPLKHLKNLEKIRRTNGPNPSSLPVDNKKIYICYK
jgi:hypothetical protein